MKILLASQSPYRKAQLEALGLLFETASPEFNEEAHKSQKVSPRNLAKALALGKARSLVAKYPDHVVIGGDQLIAFGTKILGKPGNFENAFRQLKMMSGKTHELITALVVIHKKKTFARVVIAKIKLAKLSDAEIKAYLERDRPYDCAGSYKFELGGYGLVEKIRVSDPSSLIGVPLIELSSILRTLSKLEKRKTP